MSVSACRRCQPLLLQDQEKRFWALLVFGFSKFYKIGVNIFNISILISGLESKFLMVSMRKLTSCNGIRPCSKDTLALPALMDVQLEASVRVPA